MRQVTIIAAAWALSLLAALMLAGCQTNKAASIKGACDAFEAPTQPIRGKARTDQRWIDDTVESGVSACGWKRPRAPAPDV